MEPVSNQTIARAIGALLAGTVIVGCSAGDELGTGTGGDGGGTGGAAGSAGDGKGGTAGVSNVGGTSGDSGASGSSGSGGVIDPFDTPCMGGRDAGRTPIRRLSRLEYGHVVLDVFGDVSGRAAGFVPEESLHGFASNSVSPISELAVEQYHGAASQLATCIVSGADGCSSFAELSGCATSDSACVEPFLTRTARRLFRGTLADSDRDALLEVYRSSVTELDANDAVTIAIEAMLLSPRFLYVVEFGDESLPDALVPLTPSEIAGRMALAIWRSIPDDALLAAADAGAFATADGVKTEARRLLADPKADRMFSDYVEQWLQIERLGQSTFRPEDFPGTWPAGFADWPALRAAYESETLTFFALASRNGGTLPQVLTADFTFSEQAPALYGATWDAGLGRAFLPPERRGILLQGSVLAAHSHPTHPSPVFRGRLVRERLLCTEVALPDPSAMVNMNVVRDQGETTRDAFSQHMNDSQCIGCHVLMDPIGNGFSAFDAIGLYAPSEDGVAVSTEGEVLDGDDVTGPFADAAALAERLSASTAVGRCYTIQSFRHLLSRTETLQDVCAIQGAFADFTASGLNIGELLVSMVGSDTFRYRRRTTAGGACQ